MEDRLITIEKRLNKLEKDREYMIQHIRELQIAVENVQQASLGAQQEYNHPGTAKLEYLTAANEQMFQQNQRLRHYIEECISGEKTLDQKSYLRALSGEN